MLFARMYPASGSVPPGAIRSPEFPARAEWLNSSPLTMESLRGKVVLIDFWEYTCVNCQRTLPYVARWHEQYKDKGLVVIGVHTPEFDFSGKRENVEAGCKRLGVTWPTILDSDYKVWNLYANRYWPRKYLIDAKGYIRYDHAGEGGYEETEHAIQELLAEAGTMTMANAPTFAGFARELDRPGKVCYPVTHETYCGFARGALSNPGGYREDKAAEYKDNAAYSDGVVALSGKWDARDEYVRFEGAAAENSYLALPYHATEVNLVLRPSDGHSKRVYLRLDDAPLAKELWGADVQSDAHGPYVEVTEGRMYRLVNAPKHASHTLRLLPQSAGLEAYAFTFGSCEQ